MSEPVNFSEELAAIICDRIADGESLRAICRDDGFPSVVTVRKWVNEDKQGFANQYMRARDMQADHYQELIIDEAFSAEDAAIGRLRVDALKWTASKLAPKKYGDKVTQELTGPGGSELGITVNFIKPK